MTTIETLQKIKDYYEKIRDIWQRLEHLEKLPTQLEELQMRIAKLEDRLKSRLGEACIHCGELAVRVVDTSPAGNGKSFHHLKCNACGFEHKRVVLPTGN